MTVIDNSNHVARHCGQTKVLNGKVDGSAFVLPQGQKSISVNWLEYLNKPTRPEEIRAICQAYVQKGRRVGARSWFAILQTGSTVHSVQQKAKKTIRFLHDPEPLDPSHSGIFNVPPEDYLIADLIAESVQGLHQPVMTTL